MDRENEKLLQEFPPSGRSEWESKIAQDCRDTDCKEKLTWKTSENIDVKPFYCTEDLESIRYLEGLPEAFLFPGGNKTSGNAWKIRQDIRVHDIEAANSKALYLTEKGVDAIGFDLRSIKKPDYKDFKSLVNRIDLERTLLHWIAGENPDYLPDYLIQMAEEKHVDPSCLKGSIYFVPLRELTLTGGWRRSFEEDMKPGVQLIRKASGTLPDVKTITVGGELFADAGGSSVQELGYSLATAAEYLSFYTDQGIPVKDIAHHMQLNLSTGSNYFFEIAKLRAARILWSNLIKAYDEETAKNIPVYIQSITTNWNKTAYDSRMNLLRLTTEAMAAILGGCDALLVHPYDACFREPSDFTERLARNIQIILREESYFDKVIDPAGGSYYIESLTDAICKNAWQQFMETEKKGGYLEAFKQGFIQQDIRQNAEKFRERIASGKQVLLGTNAYPDFNENIMGNTNPEVAFSGKPVVGQSVAEPVILSRASDAFEELRLAVERHAKNRPKVFMLTYGNRAMRLARSNFACNFFAAAGYEVTDNPGFNDITEGVAAALRTKADVVVACSSDDEYASTVPEVFDMIRGKAILVVAGRPVFMEDLKQKGIEDFIYTGANMIEILTDFHKKLGIAI